MFIEPKEKKNPSLTNMILKENGISLKSYAMPDHLFKPNNTK